MRKTNARTVRSSGSFSIPNEGSEPHFGRVKVPITLLFEDETIKTKNLLMWEKLFVWENLSLWLFKISTGMYDENLRSMACIACHCWNGMTLQLCCHSNWRGYTLMAWYLHRRDMFGINLKVIVAMVTELCTHSISAMACMPCSWDLHAAYQC